jgi:hydroxyacylglutathione hydrolase
MQIVMNSGGVATTNSFLIGDEASKQAVIFDAPDHTVAPLLLEAKQRGWDIIGLWLTHGHFDHVADHKLVTDAFPKAKVLIHELDEPKLIEPGSRFFQLPFEIPPRKADGYVRDGDRLKIGAIEVEAIFTPGHSPGHVMFYLPKENVLVGGDLIIGGSVGRTDLPDSNHQALKASVRKVMKLPSGTRLLPGHGQISSLGDERQSNEIVAEILGE